MKHIVSAAVVAAMLGFSASSVIAAEAPSQGADLHWTMFNIPASVTKLDAGVKAPPEGASNGPNMRGSNQAYLGPHTPPGPKHHYHLQLFALDTALGPDAGGSYAALTEAMKGHVLAEGELVGLAQADPNR